MLRTIGPTVKKGNEKLRLLLCAKYFISIQNRTVSIKLTHSHCSFLHDHSHGYIGSITLRRLRHAKLGQIQKGCAVFCFYLRPLPKGEGKGEKIER